MSNLIANWSAPLNIKALTTRRTVGYSLPPYDKNNLGFHVGDEEANVVKNRAELVRSLGLPKEPVWLQQTHSTLCVVAEEDSNREADAAITRDKTLPLAILTADCLPIVLCDQTGSEIAAIHAGWRGLVNGIIENTLHQMQSSRNTLMAWIGPAICQTCYQVGEEVRESYTQKYPFTEGAFCIKNSHIYADLPKMAELILKNLGVMAVYQSGVCSYESKNDFYSYRRESQTGRMATLIWFNDLNSYFPLLG